MLLTSAQVAEKLGVSRNYVTNMAKTGKLASVRGQHPTPSGRTNYGFDAKVVAEFRKTFIPPVPKVLKAQPVKLNGHTQELPGLGFSDHVGERLSKIDNYLLATRIEIGDRVKSIEAKVDALHALVEVVLAAWQ